MTQAASLKSFMRYLSLISHEPRHQISENDFVAKNDTVALDDQIEMKGNDGKRLSFESMVVAVAVAVVAAAYDHENRTS